MARALRRDHQDVVAGRRLNPPVVNVEAVREHERGVVGEIRRDVFLVDALLHLIGEEERDDLRVLDRLRDRADRQAGCLGRVLGRSCRAGARP